MSSSLQSLPSERSQQTHVIYIGGMSRSGSTLLDLLLGTSEGVFSAGEAKYLWERAILKGEPCACGQPYQNCPIWSQVLAESVLGAPPEEIAQEVVAIQKRGDIRFRDTRKICRQIKAKRLSGSTRWYRDLHSRVHTKLAEVTGSHTIVNSSKFPQDAALLSSSLDIKLSFVHLVRDPRGVVSSLQRKKPRQDGSVMARKSPIVSAVSWFLINQGCEHVTKLLRDSAMTVNYEQLATHPNATMETLTQAFSIPKTDQTLLYAADNHTIGGNPHRFNRAPREIQLDDRWRNDLGLLARVITRLPTGYWHKRYETSNGDQQTTTVSS